MSRRLAREMAVQALFLLDFNAGAGQELALEAVFAEREAVSPSVKEYASSLVEGTQKHLAAIDKNMAGISKEWPVDRMPGVDRNIIRMALFEMKYADQPVDAGVVINEAVELAKIFGTENSGRFINGILGSLVRVGVSREPSL